MTLVAFAALAATTLTTVPTPSPATAAAPVVDDFNGDGYADLVLGVAGEDIGAAVDAGAVTIVYGGPNGIVRSNSDTISQAGAVAGKAESGDQFGRAVGTGDFNGDGRSDLLVGAPNEGVAGLRAAGNVTVVYGGTQGLRAAGSKAFSERGPVKGAAETGDRFGSAIAVGDLNNDGYADAVIGAPGEDVGSIVDAGNIHILFGGPSGLTDAGDKAFSQTGKVAGASERDDRFGSSLALGDFDGDGRLDLVIGAPGEDIGAASDAGAVMVMYGSASGPKGAGSKMFSQSGAIHGIPEQDDRFGEVLAAGDFDGDGYDDLAVGAPGEAYGTRRSVGMVHIIYGSAVGLTTTGNEVLDQGVLDIGSNEAGDLFGAALATGDVQGDGRADLVIGSPGEDLSGRADGGRFVVVHGRNGPLAAATVHNFSQAGVIAGTVEAHDRLGSSVYIADLDGDGYDDVAVGAPGEDLGSAPDAGYANVVYGSSSGLLRTRNEGVSQAGVVAGSAESGDGLGVPVYETWLDRVNLYRQQAGLEPVSEIASLSDDARLHSQYLVRNGVVSHSENPSLPGYTAAGNASGQRSNVYGTSWAATTDLAAVDGWVTGPFHAIGFLTPTLTNVGYGVARDPGASTIRMAASLDIWGAPRDWGASVPTAYSWPGDGSVVPVRAHVNEHPSPTTSCPGHSGLPVIVFFAGAPSVGATSFTHDGTPLTHCVFDGSDYVNPDSNARDLGRAILNSANAVVLMPQQPLVPGDEYCFSATSGAEQVQTCFTVDPNA